MHQEIIAACVFFCSAMVIKYSKRSLVLLFRAREPAHSPFPTEKTSIQISRRISATGPDVKYVGPAAQMRLEIILPNRGSYSKYFSKLSIFLNSKYLFFGHSGLRAFAQFQLLVSGTITFIGQVFSSKQREQCVYLELRQ